jgi:gamma-glutamyltranspeptidase / glutathione hydrolase
LRPLINAVFTSAILLSLGSWAAALPLPPEAASGWQVKPTIITSKGVCVTAHPLATQACQRSLNHGGSAADAAITAAWVLGLVEPQSSGLGGGGYALYFDGQQLYSLDGRETAPQLAHARRFLDAHGQPLPFRQVMTSGLSVGTPSMVRLMQQLHQRFGVRAWPATFVPAIQHATHGFMVSPRLHHLLDIDPTLRQSNAHPYFYPSGHALAVGSRYRNLPYAKTLHQLSQQGAHVFYQGQMAQTMVDATRHHGGDLSLEDFAAYQVKIRPNLCLTLQQHRICSMPPSSSGGIALLQILAILDGQQTDNVMTNYTRLTNAERLAFADRDAYIADPDIVSVPIPQLVDPTYLKQRQRLALGQHLSQVQAGLFPQVSLPVTTDAPNTTHISVVDQQGRAASITLSIESAFGSQIWVDSLGFFLNNQLTDFSFLPTQSGQSIANQVAAGKRPRSSMTPTLIFDRHGQAIQGVIGSPGGSQIIGYVAQATWGLMQGHSVFEVLHEPHILRRGDATELETGRFSVVDQQAFEAAGHRLKIGEMPSGLAIIWKTPQGWQAGADPRREGTALPQH